MQRKPYWCTRPNRVATRDPIRNDRAKFQIKCSPTIGWENLKTV